MNHSSGKTRRGFTLIEVMVVVVIIIILAGLIFIAVGAGMRWARTAAEQQFVRTLVVGVEKFKQDFGFWPPLVNDASPIDPVAHKVNIQGDTGDGGLSARLYLQDSNSKRFSLRSLPIFLMGALDAEDDGVSGAGFYKPSEDGIFAKVGPKIDGLVDFSRDPDRFVREGGDIKRPVFTDRWHTAIRYYRWEPTRFPKGNARAGEVASSNVPPAAGDPAINAQLRNGGFAIVSGGADTRISDAAAGAPENKDNIVEIGQ